MCNKLVTWSEQTEWRGRYASPDSHRWYFLCSHFNYNCHIAILLWMWYHFVWNSMFSLTWRHQTPQPRVFSHHHDIHHLNLNQTVKVLSHQHNIAKLYTQTPDWSTIYLQTRHLDSHLTDTIWCIQCCNYYNGWITEILLLSEGYGSVFSWELTTNLEFAFITGDIEYDRLREPRKNLNQVEIWTFQISVSDTSVWTNTLNKW